VLKVGTLRKTYFLQLAAIAAPDADEWSAEGYQRFDTDHDSVGAIAAFETAGGLSTDGIYFCRAVIYETDLNDYQDQILDDGKNV
jgi:hypothetical protein